MKIKVDGYALSPKEYSAGTAGSYGTEELSFEFSEEWKSLTKTVTFFPERRGAISLPLTKESITLPAAVTARAGRCPYVLCGTAGGSARISLTGVILIEASAGAGNSPLEGEPSIVAAITEALDSAKNQALGAAASAEAAGKSAGDSLEYSRTAAEQSAAAKKSAEDAADYYERVCGANGMINDVIARAEYLNTQHVNDVADLESRKADKSELESAKASAESAVSALESTVNSKVSALESADGTLSGELDGALFLKDGYVKDRQGQNVNPLLPQGTYIGLGGGYIGDSFGPVDGFGIYSNSGKFDMGGARLTGIATPTGESDAVTKAYVDSHTGAGAINFIGASAEKGGITVSMEIYGYSVHIHSTNVNASAGKAVVFNAEFDGMWDAFENAGLTSLSGTYVVPSCNSSATTFGHIAVKLDVTGRKLTIQPQNSNMQFLDLFTML